MIIVSDVLDHIANPLIEQIDHYITLYGKECEDLLEPFKRKDQFMLSRPYCDMTFEYEHAEFTFLQLCNLVEMLLGAAHEQQFVIELTEQVKEMVQGRIDKVLEPQIEMEWEVSA